MKTILILEDESLIRDHIAAELKKIDPSFVILPFGSVEAIELGLPKETRLDLAILDINLESRRTGLDAAKILRMTHVTRMIFLTSYSDDETLAKIACVDPDAYITKPFGQNQLQATVKTVMKRRSSNPEKIIAGDLLTTEETVRNLDGLMRELVSADPDGTVRQAEEYFRTFEKLFFAFKEEQTKAVFESLLDKLWISSLKLQKIDLPQIKAISDRYSALVLLAIVQLKALGVKAL